MKVKIFENDFENINEEINDFIKNHKVIDIKHAANYISRVERICLFMKTKCEYCTFNKADEPEETWLRGKKWEDRYGESAIVYDTDNGTYWIETFEDVTAEIKYCPMCGRKFGEDTDE
ncbi:hypothetical protein [Lactobacillus sp. PV034]|uniref:hypothetical protein n=1 Tax=Lactobacillus sp. PV034 TaxID=2594495 RepID=UPI0022405CC7|nr:hypothetical protein [Lactobacillus sp. PV034]QNQ80802.1 hypothetical protein FP432_04155 [Lactobacillus sp. PV034]